MNKKIAIIGHPIEGDKVIKILKMLGGRDVGYNGLNSQYYYYIDEYGNIAGTTELPINKILFVIYTLKEFLEKFPYKVGDKVIVKEYKQVSEILSMRWCSERNDIAYSVSNGWFYTEKLQPYKEETIERKYNVEEYLKVWKETENGLEVVVNDNFELKEDGGKFYIIKKQPQYPKTYEECCDVLGPENYKGLTLIDVTDKEDSLYTNFIKLIRCRDAYWKIAGDEMGLGKPWEPDYKDGCIKYTITVAENEIYTDVSYIFNYVLIFPIEEMRNAFYQNFRELIEKCKTLI